MRLDPETLGRRTAREVGVSLVRFLLAFTPPFAVAYLIITAEPAIPVGAFATGAAWVLVLLVWVWFVYWSWGWWGRRRADNSLPYNRRK